MIKTSFFKHQVEKTQVQSTAGLLARWLVMFLVLSLVLPLLGTTRLGLGGSALQKCCPG